MALTVRSGNGHQADQACPNCLDRGVPCTTSSSRVQSCLTDPGTSYPTQDYGVGGRRDSVGSRPIGLISPNATSVEFSVHPKENEIIEGSDTFALGLFDEPCERSSILSDDKVRRA